MHTNGAATGETPLSRVMRQVVRKRVERARKHARAVLASDDPEAVHDLRGDVRRLRTVLALLRQAPGSHARRLARTLDQLKELARRLGVVRDLDVLRAHVREYVQAHPRAARDLRPLEADLSQRHARARRQLLRAVGGQHLWREVRQAAKLSEPRADAPGPVLVRHFAGSAIWRRYEALLAFETRVANADEATLHRLRIACKQLNMTLEAFAEPLGPLVRANMEQLTEAQQHLGALHDDVVALEHVERMLRAARQHGRSSATANGGLATYAESRAADRDRLCATVLALWARLSAPAFRQSLARAIAEL